MSYTRSISFGTNEMDLLSYFDNNGKSNLVKTALRFYRKHSDEILSDAMKTEILKLVGNIGIKNTFDERPVSEGLNSKISKLKK